MEIKVTTRHGIIAGDIQEMIQNKVANLPRLFNRLTGIQVIADMGNSSQIKVEIIASAEHANDFVASEFGPNVLTALDLTISKIEQQLRKHKQKLTEHRGPVKQAYETEE